MGQYVIRRLILAVPLLLIISMMVFGLLQAAPGGPMGAYVRRGNFSAEDLRRIEDRLGLNAPVYVQYGKWLGRVVKLDFGDSISERRPVIQSIRDRLPNTLYLMATAWVVTILIAIPVGVITAIKQYSWFDHVVTGLTFVGQSVPIFWLGLILILIFYIWLDNPFKGGPLLPAGGMYTLGADFSIWDRIVHLILPVTMLAASWVAWYTRFLRASMLEVIHQDYIRTARAKGLGERVVIMRHAFRNAAIPLITLMALDLPLIFSGALFTEVIFAWPGMGRLFFTAADRRDYPLLMAIIMITATLIVLSNLLADVLYAWLDPRIRFR
ncbi:MAG TPA: ABC transporter permease [Thermomicrobiales bacterium]|jgi:peptide/nickel transport system permease protein|nr:diguanylate cyclase [Chloroflexota bacterium]HQX62760.1 ABC transporter permease [Thermomicrobiales bacterium]HBY47102.1 diguanylate cyclase [Chloroflexota bacterium]HCG29906.1 diguanylate cyclase [Chloroflexota bacterium]HQZ91008.1 ABC transporter permease [Thermomicrobiales bacterium]